MCSIISYIMFKCTHPNVALNIRQWCQIYFLPIQVQKTWTCIESFIMYKHLWEIKSYSFELSINMASWPSSGT